MSHWFEEFTLHLTQPQNRNTLEPIIPFLRMEGRAIPYLADWLEREPSRLDRAYDHIHRRLPATISGSIPQPRDDTYYSHRAYCALTLLGAIGGRQSRNIEAGWEVSPPLVSTVVPQLRRHLRRGNRIHHWRVMSTLGGLGPIAAPALPELQHFLTDGDGVTRIRAAEALGGLGLAALPAVPELIRLAQNPDEPAGFAAINALGGIGPGASNAVESLQEIFLNQKNSRLTVIHALARIGPQAAPAIPLLIPLLDDNHTDEARISAAIAMTRIGVIPDEAMPLLNAMRELSNEHMRLAATLALWSRNPDDPSLTAQLKSSFQPEPHNLLLSVAPDLSNASRFLPEITALLDHPNENTRRNAARAIRKIKGDIP